MKMRFTSVLFISLILLQTYTLHLQLHQSTSSYLAYLKGQQEDITNSLQDLHDDITDTQSKVSNENDIDLKIKLLEEAILRQKSQLSSISKSLITPLNESQWVCENLEGTSDAELKDLADDIVESTKNLDDEINKLEGVPGSDELEKDSDMSEQYGQEIKKALDSSGTYVEEYPANYQTDLSAENWITGGKTLEEIEKEREEEEGNIVICIHETPFFDGSSCIQCPKQTPYFNLATKECIDCDDFDVETHTCPSLEYDGLNVDAAEGQLILPEDKTLDDVREEQGDNVCPDYKPFYSDGNCFNCVSPNSLFDYESGKCTSCKEGETYEAEKHQCIAGSVKITNLAAGADTMILPEGETIADIQKEYDDLAQKSDVSICPQEKPFFNAQECIECPDQYFKVETNECVTCPSGSIFNSNTHQCEEVFYYSNLDDDRWSSTNINKTKAEIEEASKKQGAKVCPVETPYFNGEKCIKCEGENSFFSFDGMKCSTCSSDSVFNINLHSCVKPGGQFQTNPRTAQNLIYGGKSKNQWITIYDRNLDSNPSIADCPAKTPFFDGSVCIICPSDEPYFNLEYRVCMECGSGSEYDETSHECLSDEGNIVKQVPNIEKMAASIFT